MFTTITAAGRKRLAESLSPTGSALMLASALSLLPVLAHAQGTVHYAPSAEPRTLDPIASPLAIAQQHGFMVYDTLIALDENLVPQPQMLEGWEVSDDRKTYTMTLREGLTFHDGSPVETADVIASINRWAKKDATGLRLVDMGMKLEEVDPRTFTVSFDVASDLVLSGFSKMSSLALVVMRQEDAATGPNEAVAEIVGSGPFRFVADEYRPGATMVYEKFADYVPRDEPPSNFAGGKVVNVDRVEWLIMPDATTAVSALQTGEIDIYESPPLDLLPMLALQDNIILRPLGDLGQFGYLRPNFKQPPFDKPEAREALALLIDQSEVMSVAAGGAEGEWQTCYSFFSCGGVNETEAGTEELQTRDVEKAKALLSEAGYNNEPVVLLAPGDNALLSSFVSVVESRLKEGGRYAVFRFLDDAVAARQRKLHRRWRLEPVPDVDVHLRGRQPGLWRVFQRVLRRCRLCWLVLFARVGGSARKIRPGRFRRKPEGRRR